MKKLFFLCLLAVPMIGQAMEGEKSDDSSLDAKMERLIIAQEKTNKLLEEQIEATQEQTSVAKAQLLVKIMPKKLPEIYGQVLFTPENVAESLQLSGIELSELTEIVAESHPMSPIFNALPFHLKKQKISEILKQQALKTNGPPAVGTKTRRII